MGLLTSRFRVRVPAAGFLHFNFKFLPLATRANQSAHHHLIVIPAMKDVRSSLHGSFVQIATLRNEQARSPQVYADREFLTTCIWNLAKYSSSIMYFKIQFLQRLYTYLSQHPALCDSYDFGSVCASSPLLSLPSASALSTFARKKECDQRSEERSSVTILGYTDVFACKRRCLHRSAKIRRNAQCVESK